MDIRRSNFLAPGNIILMYDCTIIFNMCQKVKLGSTLYKAAVCVENKRYRRVDTANHQNYNMKL